MTIRPSRLARTIASGAASTTPRNLASASFNPVSWCCSSSTKLRSLDTKRVITAEVIKKAMMATASTGSLIRKEKSGGMK
jgi:hypothetical protein